jgi:uncharacterized Zn-binding protein involved in type VI secretion
MTSLHCKELFTSGKPAARVTDPTACPLPGHGTNPIVSGSPNVNFDGLAAARMTDKSACGSPITGAVPSISSAIASAAGMVRTCPK